MTACDGTYLQSEITAIKATLRRTATGQATGRLETVLSDTFTKTQKETQSNAKKKEEKNINSRLSFLTTALCNLIKQMESIGSWTNTAPTTQLKRASVRVETYYDFLEKK